MLTPRFKLQQDENHVYITIHAPYTNIGDTEIDVDGENFLFVSSPYFLRLKLPGRIIENDRSKGSYVCDSGDFNLTFDKETPGMEFENMDMITSLLSPRDIPNINPDLVEILENDGIVIEEDEKGDAVCNEFSYGFACKLTAEFRSIGTEYPQLFELRVPEQVNLDERHNLRQQYENHKFSSDHYLADLFDKELLEPYHTAVVSWDKPEFNKDEDFTEDEVSLMKELPNKSYILTKTEHKQIFLGLVDILFGFCYDKRTTLNESTVESGWTVNKLSSTLSWFCVFNEMKDVLIACYRRALTYPMFRNFELCINVKNDVESLLGKGKKFTIKCMMNIHKKFNRSNDARYILNQLYIKDYIIFLQKSKSEEFVELSNSVANVEIRKSDLGLELEELEAAADMVKMEESLVIGNEMALKLASMTLLPGIRKIADLAYIPDTANSSTESSSGTDSSEESSSSEDLDSDDDDDPS